MPGPQLVDGAAEALGEPRVGLRLPGGERVRRSAGRTRRASRRAASRPSPTSRRPARTSRDSRAERAASLRSRASSRTSSATAAPTVFDASHASRRSATSSLSRRIRLISLSSTDLPKTSPRCCAKRDSTDASSSTMRCRSASGTCCGTRLAWRRSSWRRTSACGAVRPRRLDVAEELGVGQRIGERELGRDAPLLVLLGRRRRSRPTTTARLPCTAGAAARRPARRRLPVPLTAPRRVPETSASSVYDRSPWAPTRTAPPRPSSARSRSA